MARKRKMATLTKKPKAKKLAPLKGTRAIHASSVDGEHHAVGIWNLHVMLIQEANDLWVAQGIQIDYVVQGATPEEAKTNFEKGLSETIDLNLRVYGHIKGLLVSAPDEVLQEAATNKVAIALYDQITSHELGANAEKALPFDGVSFLIARDMQEAA